MRQKDGEKDGDATFKNHFRFPCANSACKVKEKVMFKCSRCRSAFYCSEVCQRGHWKQHKKECGPFVSVAEMPYFDTRYKRFHDFYGYYPGEKAEK